MGTSIDPRRDVLERLELLGPSSVLQVHGEPRWLIAEMTTQSRVTVGVDTDAAAIRKGTELHRGIAFANVCPQTMQLDRQFDLVIVGGLERLSLASRRAVIHTSVQHCSPRGHVAVVHAKRECLLPLDDFDLDPVPEHSPEGSPDQPQGSFVSLYRRSSRFTVHDLVFEARQTITRVTPPELLDLLVGANPPLVLDTRTSTDRMRFGVIEPSVHVPRTVLEWHLDPASGYLHPSIVSFDQSLVVACNGGYSSSLAAANLVRLGYTSVADLIGGAQAWRSAGLPMGMPDHSHLDF